MAMLVIGGQAVPSRLLAPDPPDDEDDDEDDDDWCDVCKGPCHGH